MPYVTRDARKRLAMGGTPETAGELNYIVTMALKPLYPRFMGYLILKGMSYQTFNDMFGAVTGALIEFIRRMFPLYGVYEDKKLRENGDVYRDWEE